MKLHEVLLVIVVVRILFFEWGLFMPASNDNNNKPACAPTTPALLQSAAPTTTTPLQTSSSSVVAFIDDDNDNDNLAAAPPPPPPLTPSLLPGYHTTTLTHVFFILPTNSSQNQRAVVDAISRQWRAFPPCASSSPSSSATCSSSSYSPPRLVVVMASAEPSIAKDVSPALLSLVSSSPPPPCFSSLSLALFTIHRNQSRKARRLLVEGVLRGHGVRGERGYGLFLDSTSRAVKLNWLAALQESVLFPAPAFWLKGGFQRFFYARTEAISSAVNSIAIYRLSGHMSGNEEDEEEEEEEEANVWLPADLRPRPLGRDSFAEFCMFKLFHSMIKFGIHASSEQVSIWHYLLEFKHNYNIIRYQLVHRLVLTDLLVDYRAEAGDYGGNALLVQGGSSSGEEAPPPPPLPHKDHLSHVFVVFPSFQLAAMRTALRASWTEHPPCAGEADWTTLASWQSCYDQDVQPPSLVYLVSRRREANETADEATEIDAALRLQTEQELALPATSRACFKNGAQPRVCILPLLAHEDNHVLGSKLIFEHFLRGACVTANDEEELNVALYLEPDNQPIKPRWLTSLAASTLYPAPRSLIRGSIFLGPKTKRPWRMESAQSVAKLYLHINGNALYQLGGQNAFSDYYFDHIRPAVLNKYGGKPTAMDLDVFDVLLDPPADQLEQRNRVMAAVHYTNLLGNFYGYDEVPSLATKQDFVLAHVSAGVDFMAKDNARERAKRLKMANAAAAAAAAAPP